MLSAISSRIENRRLVGSDLAILLTILLHIGEGLTFVATNQASGSIGMAALLSIFGTRALAAATLFVTAGLAVVGQWHAGIRPAVRFLLLLPQLSLLIITALGAVAAILASHYADGVPRPWIFIAWDQAHRLGMPLIYGAAIYARVRTP